MFDTEGNMKNVADIVEELDSVLGPMSDELKASTLDQLGLNRGVADAVKILSGAGDQIREYESALRAEIINAASVPANDAYIPLDGKLVLETSDYVTATAGTNSILKILVSVLETANA